MSPVTSPTTMAGVMDVLHGLDVVVMISMVAAMWVHGGDTARGFRRFDLDCHSCCLLFVRAGLLHLGTLAFLGCLLHALLFFRLEILEVLGVLDVLLRLPRARVRRKAFIQYHVLVTPVGRPVLGDLGDLVPLVSSKPRSVAFVACDEGVAFGDAVRPCLLRPRRRCESPVRVPLLQRTGHSMHSLAYVRRTALQSCSVLEPVARGHALVANSYCQLAATHAAAHLCS